ncbi:MAG: hypothetical protein M3384_12665 [Acidobacteriota bacterium]|nr:hypothetical protein [Acidobacteriota bacterium]
MINKLLLTIFSLTFPAALAAVPALAQNTPEAAVISARDQFFDIKRRSIELERMKRESEKRPASRDLTLKFPEIKKDFETIQKLNFDLLKLTAAASAETPLDNAAVSKLAAEINARAARLKSNLFPDEPKQNKEAGNKTQSPAAESESKDLKTLLGALDESINRFVHNGMFRNLKLVNPPDFAKAQKDVETVINLSRAIKVKTKS